MLNWSIERLKKVTKGDSSSDTLEKKITGISIDSRSLKKGDLFCALKGKNHDGHDYLYQAYKNGASCLLISDPNKECPSLPVIEVKNVLKALEKIAKNNRENISSKFVAITGSVGKTGTKDMVKLALSKVGKTFANRGNLNNHIGVPFSMSNIPSDSNYCVLEIGMNKLGEIKKLSKLVSPDIGIITAIENSHLNDLKTLKNILKAKSELIDNIEKTGCFIYNYDTNFSKELRQTAEKKNITNIISYGTNKDANIQILRKRKIKNKYLIEARYFDEKVSWQMPELADHWYSNSLCILGVGKHLGVDLDELLQALEEFRLPKGRGNLIYVEKWLKNFFIIDESYNSNPASLTAALTSFDKMKFAGNKIAILGDMNELGDESEKFHLNMKENIEKIDIRTIITIGKYMKRLNLVLSSKFQKLHFDDMNELEYELKDLVCSNDCILVKGSNSLGLYSLVNKLAGADYDL